MACLVSHQRPQCISTSHLSPVLPRESIKKSNLTIQLSAKSLTGCGQTVAEPRSTVAQLGGECSSLLPNPGEWWMVSALFLPCPSFPQDRYSVMHSLFSSQCQVVCEQAPIPVSGAAALGGCCFPAASRSQSGLGLHACLPSSSLGHSTEGRCGQVKEALPRASTGGKGPVPPAQQKACAGLSALPPSLTFRCISLS